MFLLLRLLLLLLRLPFLLTSSDVVRIGSRPSLACKGSHFLPPSITPIYALLYTEEMHFKERLCGIYINGGPLLIIIITLPYQSILLKVVDNPVTQTHSSRALTPYISCRELPP
jgi:hypothetical protein